MRNSGGTGCVLGLDPTRPFVPDFRNTNAIEAVGPRYGTEFSTFATILFAQRPRAFSCLLLHLSSGMIKTRPVTAEDSQPSRELLSQPTMPIASVPALPKNPRLPLRGIR